MIVIGYEFMQREHLAESRICGSAENESIRNFRKTSHVKGNPIFK
jgi:hypothetical protein